MNEQQTAELRELQLQEPTPPTIKAEGPDRTLIYGYDVDRNTFHVYVQDGKIHRFCYRGTISGDVYAMYYDAREEWPADFLVPDKRIYPEFSDYEFCKQLIRLGTNVPFGNWSEPHPQRRDFGIFNGSVQGLTIATGPP